MDHDTKDNRLEIVTPGTEEDDFLARRRARTKTPPKSSCTRCGSCCTSGTPVLLKDDLALFADGTLSHEALYAVREGELLWSVRDEDYYEAPLELIKVKGKDDSAVCVFYSPETGCSVYDKRPLQCREFECWAPTPPFSGLEERALQREDLFGTVKVLMDVMGRHNDRCSYARLADTVRRAEQGEESAVEEVLDMLSYDTYLRPSIQEQLSVPSDAMDLVLGRPLLQTIEAFGLKVERDGESYTLVRSDRGQGTGGGSEAP